MYKTYFHFIIYLLSFTSLLAQKQTTFESKYVDILAKDNKVYALSKTNKLVVWDMLKGDIQYIKKEISCIQLSKKQQLLCSTTEGEILKEKGHNSWEKIGAFTGKPFAIFLTSTNKPVALSSKGIKFNNVYHMPNEKHRIGNGMYSYKNNKLRKPQLCYLDNDDRVWISYDFGKFSEVFIFDTKKGDFVNNKVLFVNDNKKTFNSKKEYLTYYQKEQLKNYPYYVKVDKKGYLYRFPTEAPLYFGLKSICQDQKDNYYFSEGLAYSHKNSGIFKYEKSNEKDFYYIVEHLEDQFKKKNEIIGALTFNNYNNSLYYYSNYGFHKLIQKEGKLESELIVDPNILLYNKKISHEYGSLMNVKKISFLDKERFAFLTSQYGFGYFDGENVNLFN